MTLPIAQDPDRLRTALDQLSGLRYAKGQGTGNDFVLVPDPDGETELSPDHVAALCDRHFGVGGDGLIRVVESSHLIEGRDLLQDHENSGVISSEFLAASITSGSDGLGEDDDFTRTTRSLNPHLKAMTDKRGYVLCDVTRDQWHADLKILDRVMVPDEKIKTHASFVVERGRPGLQSA